MNIIIHEDKRFIQKIKRDFDLESDVLIIYSGLRIKSVSITRFNFGPVVVISEYYNFLPRLIAWLLRAKTLAIIYGVLNEFDFTTSIKFAPKKLGIRLFSDEFWVVNRRSTFELLKTKFVNVRIKELGNSLKSPVLRGFNDAIIFITQPWKSEGMIEKQGAHDELLQVLVAKNRLKGLIVHPRDNRNYSDYDCLLFEGMMDFIEKTGTSKLILLGCASSAMLELHDLGYMVFRSHRKEFDDFIEANSELRNLDVLDVLDL